LKIKETLIYRVLAQKKYFFLFLVFTLAMAVFYPVVQVSQQGVNNFFFWFSLLKTADWIFFIALCVIFGLNFSLFSWRNDRKICSSRQKIKTGFFGGLGAFLATVLPLCPQCLSFLALLLPVGFLGVLVQYRFWVMAASVSLMVWSLFILGAFDRTENRI